MYIDGLDWERLPTLHHVVLKLAEIPIYEVIEAQVVEGAIHQADLVNLISFNLDMISFSINLSTSHSC